MDNCFCEIHGFLSTGVMLLSFHLSIQLDCWTQQLIRRPARIGEDAFDILDGILSLPTSLELFRFINNSIVYLVDTVAKLKLPLSYGKQYSQICGMQQVFCFACEYKSSATLPSNVIIQECRSFLVLFNVINIVLYQQPHKVLDCLFLSSLSRNYCNSF